MEIEHSLDDNTQIKYGLLTWKKQEDDKYRQVLPDGEFTIDFLGKKIPSRRVDWERHRLSIGPKNMEGLKPEDKLLISRTPDGTVIIKKKKEKSLPKKVLFVTYCSRKKRTYPERYAPAINRYDSLRIERVYEESLKRGKDFAILSGKYGLIRAHTMIRWYDKKLEDKDINRVSELVKDFLRRERIEKVVYYTEPLNEDENLRHYYKCIRKACKELDISFQEVEIPRLPVEPENQGTL